MESHYLRSCFEFREKKFLFLNNYFSQNFFELLISKFFEKPFYE